MNGDLLTRLTGLRAWLSPRPFVAVAYSGGVDSSLLLKVAWDTLGERCCAILAVSPSLPGSEREAAAGLARQIGAPLHLVETCETDDPAYQANAPNRCFFCKDQVYRTLIEHALTMHPAAVLVDGMNADDTLDIRPGRAAALRHGVVSPLYDLGFTKADVREAARELGLSVWDKPAAACLASRIAYGTPVSNELLSRLEKAEAAVRALGFQDLRVRHHGDIARLEVPVAEMEAAVRNAGALASALKTLGWLYVTLDLEGLRHGSMNAPLKNR